MYVPIALAVGVLVGVAVSKTVETFKKLSKK
jgi:hypothetical protein